MMDKRVLVIGAGGVAQAYVRKAVQLNLFRELHIASRTLATCVQLQDSLPDANLHVYELDADDVSNVVNLLTDICPDLVVHLALPYQDLAIMEACLVCGVSYLDTANYEPKDEAKFCYKWQWDYHQRFQNAGLMALLGAGFDPGVTNVFCEYANRYLFDRIDVVDILDCNAGDHGRFFATNFNPEINIREITQKGKYYQEGRWIETQAFECSRVFDFPQVGHRKAYLLYHEELESLVKHIPSIHTIRFWMTFSDQYLNGLNVLQEVGLTGINPIEFNGQSIVPLQFLKACLPNPVSLASKYTGKTCIGCLIRGEKKGEKRTVFLYNVCDHETTYHDVQAQAVSFTTAIPALIGSQLLLEGIWQGAGVFNMEQMSPKPFMDLLPQYGLSWHIMEGEEVVGFDRSVLNTVGPVL